MRTYESEKSGAFEWGLWHERRVRWTFLKTCNDGANKRTLKRVCAHSLARAILTRARHVPPKAGVGNGAFAEWRSLRGGGARLEALYHLRQRG